MGNNMIPIMFNHDFAPRPIGYLQSDGKIKLREDAGITLEQLCDLEVGYIAKTISANGVVLEAELVELSIVVKK